MDEMKRPQIEKYEYNPETNTVEINDKFEIDFIHAQLFARCYALRSLEYLTQVRSLIWF